MGDREETIRFLTDLKRQKMARRDLFMRPLQRLEKDIENISATIALILDAKQKASSEVQNFPLEKLRGLSQKKAVLAIARHNGGTIQAQNARRIMIQAGVLREGKNATRMVHNAIITSEKFERIGRGEFRLKDTPQPKLEELDHAVLFPSKPVQ